MFDWYLIKKLKKYARKGHIVVIEQRTKEVSLTRNKGLFISQGEFITFVNSDDFIDLSTYERCIWNL